MAELKCAAEGAVGVTPLDSLDPTPFTPFRTPVPRAAESVQ